MPDRDATRRIAWPPLREFLAARLHEVREDLAGSHGPALVTHSRMDLRGVAATLEWAVTEHGPEPLHFWDRPLCTGCDGGEVPWPCLVVAHVAAWYAGRSDFNLMWLLPHPRMRVEALQAVEMCRQHGGIAMAENDAKTLDILAWLTGLVVSGGAADQPPSPSFLGDVRLFPSPNGLKGHIEARGCQAIRWRVTESGVQPRFSGVVIE